MSALSQKPKPPWLRRRLVFNSTAKEVNDLLRDLSLHTVCQEAHCPNQSECFGDHTATFLVLGDHCSRNCTFCAVTHGVLEAPDPNEPKRVADAVSRLGLNYVVLTYNYDICIVDSVGFPELNFSTSLAVDSENRPHISYVDYTVDGKWRLRYAPEPTQTLLYAAALATLALLRRRVT